MSESPQKNRISVKTSKAEKTNSQNGSPGELDHDTSQLARRARPCCRSTRRRARPRHEPARPASTKKTVCVKDRRQSQRRRKYGKARFATNSAQEEVNRPK
ncbi:hypothetical protein F2Q69_00021936 [Brassica cretica]|uniref:Uncharacterized protein n=1 Tax=Brassica cretica TaxID=69181 RepID=A0A8S9QJY7_BRACR|nr:hypothetical protein F2Q69_00021936 [Brassica cretica]